MINLKNAEPPRLIKAPIKKYAMNMSNFLMTTTNVY